MTELQQRAMSVNATTPEPYSVTVKRASELTGLSKTRLYQLAQSGQIERRYPKGQGFRYVLIWKSLRDWIDRQPDDPELVS